MSRGKTAKGLATKKIEMRRCVACRQVRHKSELLRVVKTSSGEISVDEATKIFGRNDNVTFYPVDAAEICDETNSTTATKKIFGRGAYVCKSEICAAALKKRHGLDKTFKCKVPDDVYEKILTAVATDV